MKVYVVREIYGALFGIFETQEKALSFLDILYSDHKEIYQKNGWNDDNENDWIVEEWEVE